MTTALDLLGASERDSLRPTSQPVIGGFTESHGSRKGFGALLVGYYADGGLRYAGRVGTGYNDDLLVSLRARLDRIAFGFAEWTRTGKLRHARFLGLRRDKDLTEVRRERPGTGS